MKTLTTWIIGLMLLPAMAATAANPSGTVTDVDGNVYPTITIGTQVWMAENLKVTHYRSGDSIVNVTDPVVWNGLATGAYCEYGNNVSNVAVYGRLYNWFVVADSLNIAPAGWHVPADSEWQILVDHLGGSAVAGGRMKDTGTAYWSSPNTGATNESGFTGLPGGGRGGEGTYSGMGNIAGFWSSTKHAYFTDRAWNRLLRYNDLEVIHDHSGKRSGASIRCVRDDAAYLCGDANGDAAVDISDAVNIIQYIFSGGPAPNPLAAGDANHDGSVDISDVVYLIQYIFSGGPSPCAELESTGSMMENNTRSPRGGSK
jgi:uncharacterized protein (TIGR02145 family)